MDKGQKMRKHITKQIRVGDILIGGGAPLSIQSMTNTDTRDIKSTVEQIARLTDAGCQIVRCAVPNAEAADAIGQIKKKIRIPLVADIHFDHRLAIDSILNGADKIRINPGNIGDGEKVNAVLNAAKERGIPVRIGVNSGSLEKHLKKKHGGVTAKALTESAVEMIKFVEGMDFHELVISLKASDVRLNYEAHLLLIRETNYPLHIGITEAGTGMPGKIKSAVGIGSLLMAGIGDTLRVSLTGDPVEEIFFAKELLNIAGIRKGGIDLISCPTCGRTRVDLINLTASVEERLKPYREMWIREERKPIKIAVMGCEVNGPGEASEADMGIAFGKDRAVVFKKGTIIGTYSPKNGLEILFGLLKEEMG
ncbi:MAG TPA: flavodoxin-dependent (E)-4-hydroxy-3-methylbut-2-enyl-diphosphate synthase [Anaerovoracaceae bacterium]|nr:flavodoxin-dependent (E)-4-hydroxy-3-methylbut-2-enyl-diphosphate synthase [Anaerovoracaceae bacterium]